MRNHIREQEWRRWKVAHPEELDYLRQVTRDYCDSRLASDPSWTPDPNTALPWALKGLDIDDEYMNLKPHSFITVRVDKSWSIDKTYTLLQGLKYKWLHGAEAVIEGYGSGLNPHCHLLVPDQPHKGNAITLLSKKFGVDRSFIDFKKSDCPTLFQTRQGYIRGEKVGDKVESWAADNDYRETHSVPHVIIFSH